MRFLLDTNIVSDLVRNPRGRIFDRISEVGEKDVCTSIVVAAELRYGATKKKSARLSSQLEAVLGAIEVLARISHKDKRIGAENQRKLFCENDFSMIRRRPRCRQSVAQNGLILESLKGGLWTQRSMPGW